MIPALKTRAVIAPLGSPQGSAFDALRKVGRLFPIVGIRRLLPCLSSFFKWDAVVFEKSDQLIGCAPTGKGKSIPQTY